MRKVVPRLLFLTVVIALGTYAYARWTGPRGIRYLLEKDEAIRKLEGENRFLEQQVKTKRKHLDRLENDPAVLRREIEKRTGKLPPGVSEYWTDEP
jgi:cell division protein FtsB